METPFRALAEPRRREILRLLTSGELTSGAVASHFEVTGPAISQHLRVLADAGLVTMRREGTRRLYKTRPEGLAEVQEFLATFWANGLERMAAEAETEERRTSHGSTN